MRQGGSQRDDVALGQCLSDQPRELESPLATEPRGVLPGSSNFQIRPHVLRRAAQPFIELLTPGGVELTFVAINEPVTGLSQDLLAQLGLGVDASHVLPPFISVSPFR